MARRVGLEPTVYRLEVCCLILLATDAYLLLGAVLYALIHAPAVIDLHVLIGELMLISVLEVHNTEALLPIFRYWYWASVKVDSAFRARNGAVDSG